MGDNNSLSTGRIYYGSAMGHPSPLRTTPSRLLCDVVSVGEPACCEAGAAVVNVTAGTRKGNPPSDA